MEDALIAEAVAKGRVTKCPPGMAADALQLNAQFMRDRFGEMAPGLVEERMPPTSLNTKRPTGFIFGKGPRNFKKARAI